jgi:hypothetical protein
VLAPVVTVSFFWAQAPKLKAVAKTATIMISLKSFNLSRLLSQQVAPVSLGRELQGSNVFLDFFGCVSDANRRAELSADASRAAASYPIYSSMITGVS